MVPTLVSALADHMQPYEDAYHRKYHSHPYLGLCFTRASGRRDMSKAELSTTTESEQ